MCHVFTFTGKRDWRTAVPDTFAAAAAIHVDFRQGKMKKKGLSKGSEVSGQGRGMGVSAIGQRVVRLRHYFMFLFCLRWLGPPGTVPDKSSLLKATNWCVVTLSPNHSVSWCSVCQSSVSTERTRVCVLWGWKSWGACVRTQNQFLFMKQHFFQHKKNNVSGFGMEIKERVVVAAAVFTQAFLLRS